MESKVQVPHTLQTNAPISPPYRVSFTKRKKRMVIGELMFVLYCSVEFKAMMTKHTLPLEYQEGVPQTLPQ